MHKKVRFYSDFCQLVVFSLVNLWGHVKIAILYTALFPLWVSHPILIKTRNPAHSYVCNSCSYFQLKSQIQQQKKSQILHPTSHQLFWSPSFSASVHGPINFLSRGYVLKCFNSPFSYQIYTSCWNLFVSIFNILALDIESNLTYTMSWNMILCLWLLRMWFSFVLSLTLLYSKKHLGNRGGSQAIFRHQWVG